MTARILSLDDVPHNIKKSLSDALRATDEAKLLPSAGLDTKSGKWENVVFRLDAADRPAKKARGGVSVKTLADPAKAALVPMLHAKCQQDLAAVRAELTAQIDELRGTQLAMLSAFAHAWPLLKQHEPLTLPSLVPTLQLVLPRAVAANATEADARVGALLQENARLKRETRIAEAERDSAVESLERLTQKYNDLKRMRNIKRVTFVGGA